MTKATLQIDGSIYGGWKSVEFFRSIEQGAASFELGVTEKWAGQKTRRAIIPGGAYVFSLNDAAVAAGYVEDIEPTYDATTHDIKVSARDRIGDIVDCAAVVDGPYEFSGLGLAEIATRLCKPFGVSVRAEVDLGASFDRFAIQPGETAWEAIERACRYRAVLPNSDGMKTLVLSRAGRGGRATGALKLGENIKRAQGKFSTRERFSLVVVKGQQEPSDELDAVSETQPEGRANDRRVTRYRPTVIIAEQAGNDVSFADRAAWNVRFAQGRSQSVTYTAYGWHDAGGSLWTPNKIVPVVDEYQDIDKDLLIVSTRQRIDRESGEVTDIQVAPVEAYDLLPEPEPAPASADLWGDEVIFQ
jgi:prophage tail gpP-like protein